MAAPIPTSIVLHIVLPRPMHHSGCFLTSTAPPSKPVPMNTASSSTAHAPGRPSADLPTLDGNRFVMPAVVIPVVTPDHFTPAAAVLHLAQGIVRRVTSEVSLPATLGEETLFKIFSSALSTQFGEPATEGLPALRGATDPSWRLVQLAEHLGNRQVQSSVIEAAMKEALR
jgi:hypothetical protein